MDWVVIQKAFYDWVVASSGLAADHVVWQQQRSAARPGQPAISMRIARIETHGTDWLDIEDNTFTFTPIAITSVDDTANTLTKVAHGLVTGDGPVRLTTTGVLPANLELATDYWVIRTSADVIQLAANYTNTGGGNIANPITAINLGDVGTGVHTISNTVTTVHAGQEIRHLARGLRTITLVLECHTTDGVGMGMAQAVLQRILGRQALPGINEILLDAGLSFTDDSGVRAINGTQSAVLFEPRALLELRFSAASEEELATTIIEHGEIINQSTGTTWVVPD